jgi:hypothetical protein
MLLVYPPAARSTEPPLGIARLAGALRAAGQDCLCLDLCQEGYEHLLGIDFQAADAFSRGAKKRRERALELLRSPRALLNRDRYVRAVGDLNRCLSEAGKPFGLSISLSDYQDGKLSPLKRSDLSASARGYAASIFFPLYESRVGGTMDSGAHREVGISICYLSQALPAFALMGFLRERYPQAKIVLGGSLLASWAGQGLIGPEEDFGGLADAVIADRGEESLLEWLRGRGRSGVGERSARATPDFSDFRGLGYLSPLPVLPYNFSWGCPYRLCSFCPERAEGRRYRATEPVEALRHIRAILERQEAGLLHFTDSEIGPPYLRALADDPPGKAWYGFARFGGDLLDPAFCRRLAASGCVMLQLGLESGDQEVLDALGKGIRLDEARRILANLKEAGIGSFVYLLFGTGAEDEASARRTLAFTEANAELIDFLNIAVFNLPAALSPGEGVPVRSFSEADLSLYREFSHPRGWNRDRVRRFLKEEFEASSRIRPIVMRSPPTFTSNHAAFFLMGEGKGSPDFA